MKWWDSLFLLTSILLSNPVSSTFKIHQQLSNAFLLARPNWIPYSNLSIPDPQQWPPGRVYLPVVCSLNGSQKYLCKPKPALGTPLSRTSGPTHRKRSGSRCPVMRPCLSLHPHGLPHSASLQSPPSEPPPKTTGDMNTPTRTHSGQWCMASMRWWHWAEHCLGLRKQ